jgi:tetratricopeptide (TPR) repeat protein
MIAKHVLLSLAAVALIAGCSSKKNKPVTIPPEMRESDRDQKDAEQLRPLVSNLRIRYQNAAGGIEMNVDPMDEDLIIDFSGRKVRDTVFIEKPAQESKTQDSPPVQYAAPPQNIPNPQYAQQSPSTPAPAPALDSTPGLKQPGTQSWERISEPETDKVLKLIARAQQQFYAKEYEDAIQSIDQSLSIYETAEAHALKGSVRYMQKQEEAALQSWKRALQMDSGMEDVKTMIRRVESRRNREPLNQ